MTHYTDGIPGVIVHFDVSAAGYNKQAAKQIEQEAVNGASAAYNTADITNATRAKYLEQEAGRVSRVIDNHAARTVLVVELPNGLGEFARLDKNGNVVSTYWDKITK